MTADPPPDDREPGTVFMPGRGWDRLEPTSPWPPRAQPSPETSSPNPPGRVQIGSVLNGIYEVRRFIARGGMGEVFEGVNVNDDHERVAIKVILPHLATDPNVCKMFLAEARVLIKLSHPALVQYRVMAREPTLDVFYHVCEFIDGEPLSECLGRYKPTSADLRKLIRRMAEGLRAAHHMGAIHRDMSPDNIMLPKGGDLAQAKIIDFGIAKNLDPGQKSIVGDGFAGKLGYVAPEQLGDFGREVRPWTDIYSLGLVILTFAAGRPINMGATLVEAVDRRRAGPDLSPIPEDLRPLIADMVVADPGRRLPSMDEVLKRLDGRPGPADTRAPDVGKSRTPSGRPDNPRPPIWRGVLPFAMAGLAAVILVVGAIFLHASKPTDRPVENPIPAPAPPAETVRQAIEAALPNIACSWLDIERVSAEGAGVAVGISGVAGNPAAAQAAVGAAANGAGVSSPDITFKNVSPVDQGVCATLNAIRPRRAATSVGGKHLSISETTATLENGKRRVLLRIALGDLGKDISIFFIGPDGGVTPLLADRTALVNYINLGINNGDKDFIRDTAGDTYQIPFDMSPPAGIQGFLLLSGRGPIDTQLVAADPSAHSRDWKNRIAQAAQAGGWKAEMVWIKVVNPS